jgi:hypothetical protein
MTYDSVLLTSPNILLHSPRLKSVCKFNSLVLVEDIALFETACKHRLDLHTRS